MKQHNLNKIQNPKSRIPASPAGRQNPYLLYVGNAYPHKNLERLLQVFKILISSIECPASSIQLVLVGKDDFFYQRLKKLAQELGLGDCVIFTGPIKNKDLKDLYKNALAYIFPSLMEGFGLPGLEAMVCGCPVLASRVGPLPEIYGEAALYFDPYDINDIAAKMQMMINDENLRKELREKGFSQVKKYSWQKCAEKTLEVYRNLLKQDK